MSDLQCAATVIVTTAHGRTWSRELAQSLTGRRVALVYTAGTAPAVETAEVAAAVLEVPVRVRDDLGEPAYDEQAGLHRIRAELEAIADLHRGETVLVVGDGGVMSLALSRLAGMSPGQARGSVPSNTSTIELRADADGWVCTSWAGDVPQ